MKWNSKTDSTSSSTGRSKISEPIIEITKEIAELPIKINSKVSAETKILMKRKEITKDSDARCNIEYIQLCKTKKTWNKKYRSVIPGKYKVP